MVWFDIIQSGLRDSSLMMQTSWFWCAQYHHWSCKSREAVGNTCRSHTLSFTLSIISTHWPAVVVLAALALCKCEKTILNFKRNVFNVMYERAVFSFVCKFVCFRSTAQKTLRIVTTQVKWKTVERKNSRNLVTLYLTFSYLSNSIETIRWC